MVTEAEHPDVDLYGGGRKGAKVEWNDFDEKEEDYDRQEKQEEREKNQRKRFIMKEFKKRNQGGETSRAAPEEWEPPDEDCVLRDASSRRIARLTVKAREHCLHMLEVALRDNFVAHFTDDPAKIASSDYEPKVTAIDLEFEVFKASKMINIYKASVMKKNNEIKKMTKSQLLHPSLVPSWAESKDKTSPENSPSSDRDEAPAATFSGFQKASELTCIRDRVPEEETNCDIKNSKINNMEEEEKKEEVVVKKEVPQITYFFEKLDKKSEDCKSDKDKVCDEKTRTKVSSIKYFFEKDSKENSPEKIDLCSTSQSNTSHSEGSSAVTSGPESISSTSPTSHQGSCRSESPYTVVDLTRDQETPAMMVDLTSSSPASSHRQSSRSRSSSPGWRSVDTLSSRSTGSPTSHTEEVEPPAKKQRIQADVTNATSDVRRCENDSRKQKDARGAVETRECKSEVREGWRKDGRNNGETRERRERRSESSERGEKSRSAQLESGGGDGGGACNDKNRTKTLNSSLQSDKILPEMNSRDGRESGRKTCEAHNNSGQNQREKLSYSALTREGEKPGTSTRDQTRPGYEKERRPEKTRKGEGSGDNKRNGSSDYKRKAEGSGEKTRKLEGSGDRMQKGEGSGDNNRKGEGEKMRGNPQWTNPPTQTLPATNRPTKPPPDPRSGPAPNTSNKKKKEATELKTSADMVVKYLTVHYKNGQIASKEVFKGMARILSHKIADERLAGDELKKRVKELLKFLFKRCPKITTEQQVKDAMSI